MELKKTTQYSLRILSLMASDEKEFHSAEYLHEKLNIPYRYLRKIMNDLAKKGFVDSARGRNGGYKLNRESSVITVFEVIDVLENLNSNNKCFLGFDSCLLSEKCAMHDIWTEINEKLYNKFNSITLKDFRKAHIK